MRRIITLVVLALILSACSKPATPTSIPSTATRAGHGGAANTQRAGCFRACLHRDPYARYNERMGNHGYRCGSDE